VEFDAVAHGDHDLSALVVVKEVVDRCACFSEGLIGGVGPGNAEAVPEASRVKRRLNLSVSVENSVGDTGFIR